MGNGYNSTKTGCVSRRFTGTDPVDRDQKSCMQDCYAHPQGDGWDVPMVGNLLYEIRFIAGIVHCNHGFSFDRKSATWLLKVGRRYIRRRNPVG